MRSSSSVRVVVALAVLLFSTSNGRAGGGPKGSPPLRHGTVMQSDRVAVPNAVRAATADDLIYGEPILYHNLSLVPVGTKHQGPFQRYTLLEEGLAAQTLSVRELNGQSDEAQVEAVEVRNKGTQPVYLLGGEMILGGKQDRIISQDTAVPPNGKWTQVAVFCVEQGRWHGQNMRFQAGEALAHIALRKAAMSGNQSEVWAEVARNNLANGTQSSTSTYRRTIQNARVRAKIAPYRAEITQRLPKDVTLAGVVFAINGRIRVADLFGNPPLFAALKDKLISAYLLEALGEQVDRRAAPVSKGQAQEWLSKARGARKIRLKAQGSSTNYKKEGDLTIGAETVDSNTGKAIRETYIQK